MKIILHNHVKGLGQKGEVKEVSPGYFRNMLAPRRLASVANEGAISLVKHQTAKATEKLETMKESAESIKKKIDGNTINLSEKVSDTGKLYASVSQKEVADAIKAQLKVEIPAKAIEMADHIKEVGEYELKIILHKEVSAKLKLNVTAE